MHCTCTIGQVHMLVYLSLLYKAEKLSVCLSDRHTDISAMPACIETRLARNKAESSGTIKYIFKSLHVRLLIHTSAQKALV